MQRKKTKKSFITVTQSRIHSKGVFANQDIFQGTRVIEYVGERLTKNQASSRADIPLARHKTNASNGAVYIFELNKRYDIDGDVPYNTAKYINHSCDPNCETAIIRGRIWIIAIRDIKIGEEITYNYGYDYEDFEDHACRCGAEHCIGFILAEDHWWKLRRKRTLEAKARSKNHKKRRTSA